MLISFQLKSFCNQLSKRGIFSSVQMLNNVKLFSTNPKTDVEPTSTSSSAYSQRSDQERLEYHDIVHFNINPSIHPLKKKAHEEWVNPFKHDVWTVRDNFYR